MSMNTNEKKCQYDMQCEDYAKDGTWKGWEYKTGNPAPAKWHIHFFDKISQQDFEYDVCDGCKSGLESDCDGEQYELLSLERIAPQTESYDGKRGKNGISKVFDSRVYV